MKICFILHVIGGGDLIRAHDGQFHTYLDGSFVANNGLVSESASGLVGELFNGLVSGFVGGMVSGLFKSLVDGVSGGVVSVVG